MANSTERFSDRVDNYIKYRPSYPDAVIDTLVSQCKLTPQSIVADVGSGTGIFSGLLLKHNIQVMAVEPNDSMRKAAENLLASSTGFSSIAGQSEQTNLADASVDLITAAQAFHWFDRELTQREFSRILKPAGHVALIWNQRKSNTPFLKEYDDMLSVYATDYNSVNHMNIADTDIEEFYGSRQLSIFDFDNLQEFDLAGVKGRLESSSYVPKPGTKGHLALMEVVDDLFRRYQQDGKLSIEYNTRLYLARPSSVG